MQYRFAVNFGTLSKNFKQEAKNIQQDKCERGGEDKYQKEDDREKKKWEKEGERSEV